MSAAVTTALEQGGYWDATDGGPDCAAVLASENWLARYYQSLGQHPLASQIQRLYIQLNVAALPYCYAALGWQRQDDPFGEYADANGDRFVIDGLALPLQLVVTDDIDVYSFGVQLTDGTDVRIASVTGLFSPDCADRLAEAIDGQWGRPADESILVGA